MSRKVTDFANSWVAENVNAESYDPGKQVIDAHVARLVADAKQEGLTEQQLENELGSLSDFISEALDSSADDEVSRMVDKDPY